MNASFGLKCIPWFFIHKHAKSSGVNALHDPVGPSPQTKIFYNISLQNHIPTFQKLSPYLFYGHVSAFFEKMFKVSFTIKRLYVHIPNKSASNGAISLGRTIGVY